MPESGTSNAEADSGGELDEDAGVSDSAARPNEGTSPNDPESLPAAFPSSAPRAVCGDGEVDSGEVCDGAPQCTRRCSWRFDPTLLHRYAFDGSGSDAVDSISGENGVVHNTLLNGRGELQLSGGATDQYVDLPNGLTRGLTNVTIESWLTWSGSGTSLFDIGYNSAGDGRNTGIPTTRFYLTLRDQDEHLAAHINFSQQADDDEQDAVVFAPALSPDVLHHVAVVFSGASDELELYVDGKLVDRALRVTGMLAQIDDRNVWIGRSNGGADSLAARVVEFRIYGDALSADAIAASFEAGSDPEP